MSQETLAQMIGVDQSAISQIESGKRTVSAVELRNIARVLNVSSEDLLAF